MRTSRQRGHSFHDGDAAEGAPGTSVSSSSPGRSTGSGEATERVSGSSTDSESSGGVGVNPSRGSGDSFDSSLSGEVSEEQEEEEEDDAALIRGRSRSRSICGGSPEAPDMGTGPGIVKYDPSNPPPSKGSKENPEAPPVPKTGPLAQHEMQVLKKVGWLLSPPTHN